MNFSFFTSKYSSYNSGVINLNTEKNPEFDDYKWVPFWFPLRRVVDFKKEAYRKALIEFKDKMN